MPSDSSLFFGAPPEIFEKARLLRKNMTPAEKVLWEKLKNRRLLGFKFRRQHPISHFIVDFYCPEAKLVIELDGSVHDIPEEKTYDEARTAELQQMGLSELRFRNRRVLLHCDKVLQEIENKIMHTISTKL